MVAGHGVGQSQDAAAIIAGASEIGCAAKLPSLRFALLHEVSRVHWPLYHGWRRHKHDTGLTASRLLVTKGGGATPVPTGATTSFLAGGPWKPLFKRRPRVALRSMQQLRRRIHAPCAALVLCYVAVRTADADFDRGDRSLSVAPTLGDTRNA